MLAHHPAKIQLETGEIFSGYSPFPLSEDVYCGEVVFNTGMVGYVEALTDPSYRGQILTFTYPLIGNYGIPDPSAWESDAIQAAGMVCSECATFSDHYLQKENMLAWCERHGLPVITGVDTRALTKVLRKHGVVAGVICAQNVIPKKFININQRHLVSEISIKEPIVTGNGKKRIVVVDCGIKANILRHLNRFDVTIKRVPFDQDLSQEDYDGLFISNGPGDPTQCTQTIKHVREALTRNKPTFGICLGAQIMALAIGAKTYKLPFGHRAQNHPCLDLKSNRCYLTSQNHGYAIEEKSLPQDWQVLFRHLNDDTVQGIAHEKAPYFAVQFHPEAAPGPVDTAWLFEKFISSM